MAIPEDEPGRAAAVADAPAATRAADHAMGLELQIEELEEQRARAEVQGRTEDAARLGDEIGELQLELARTAEAAATALDPDGPALDPTGAVVELAAPAVDRAGPGVDRPVNTHGASSGSLRHTTPPPVTP